MPYSVLYISVMGDMKNSSEISNKYVNILIGDTATLYKTLINYGVMLLRSII